MLMDIITDEKNGTPWSAPDIEDPRIKESCHKCGSEDKNITSFVALKTLADMHRMECANCGKYICFIPPIYDPSLAKYDHSFVMGFGKHKGSPMRIVPSGYLLWIRDSYSGSNLKVIMQAGEHLKKRGR